MSFWYDNAMPKLDSFMCVCVSGFPISLCVYMPICHPPTLRAFWNLKCQSTAPQFQTANVSNCHAVIWSYYNMLTVLQYGVHGVLVFLDCYIVLSRYWYRVLLILNIRDPVNAFTASWHSDMTVSSAFGPSANILTLLTCLVRVSLSSLSSL